MGGIVTKLPEQGDISEMYSSDNGSPQGIDAYESKWRECKTSAAARLEYELDGTLPKDASPQLLELREFLDDMHLLRPLGLFAKSRNNVEVLMCWVDIQAFKSIHEEAIDYRRSTAMHIYHKYVKTSASVEIEGIDEDLKEHIYDILEDAKDEMTELPTSLFDPVQLMCFLRIYDDIFVQFKKSTAYTAVIADLKTNYNQVVPSDFEYMEKLGQGTFGLVIHCKKKSSGKHYAMVG